MEILDAKMPIGCLSLRKGKIGKSRRLPGGGNHFVELLRVSWMKSTSLEDLTSKDFA